MNTNSQLTMLLSLAVSLSLVACDVGPGSKVDEASHTSQRSLSVIPNDTAWAKGTNWSYEDNFVGFAHAWVYRPKGFSKKVADKRAAVIHLIGCGQVPYQVAQGGGWPQVAEDYGMVIVVPEIVAPVYPNASAVNIACYNYGAGSPLPTMPTRTSADHAAIIAAASKLVKERTELAIDPHQIYLAGLSAGGAVAMQVACMAPDVFAGVGVTAGPAMGTNQNQAVLAPNVTAAQVKTQCTNYAKSGSLSDPLTTLSEETWVIVSDNNGLPAGNPVQVNGVWTADKFVKQTIWDGDKFCPYANHTLVSGAIPSLLSATKSGSRANIAFSGTGTGCTGGEASHDDTAETECTFANAKSRAWQAQADVWKNAAGLSKLTWITQDTLRHRWPTGPLGALDHAVTPDRQWMVDNGYIKSDGQFDDAKVAAEPNGALGALYFAPDAFSLPAFLAKTWSENNPRIVANVTPLSVTAAAAVSGTTVTVSGGATPGLSVSSVSVTVNGSTKTATLTSGEPATYTVDFTVTTVGTSTASVTATDTAGKTAQASIDFTIQGTGDAAPVIDSAKATVSGTTLTVTGTAHDDDGDLNRIELVIGIAGSACTGTTHFTCTVDLGSSMPVGDHTATALATDAKGHTATLDLTYTVPVPGSAPVIDSQKASVSGSTLTVTGTAHDADNDLSKVEVSVAGHGGTTACTGTASFTCTVNVSSFASGTYTATLVATDAKGNASTVDVAFAVSTATCFTAKNTEHVAAGRAHLGSFYTTSAFANGTNQYLGYASSFYDQTSSVQLQSAGSWALVSSCP
jgi:poly(hydroxyalkanoate) depolymerase family esterase